MKNAINWFEIPTHDMDKAVRFYEKVIGVALERQTFGDVPHAVFPTDRSDASVTGALVGRAATRPGAAGVVIYLNAPDGVEACLQRVKAAGGAVEQPTTAIGPHGWIGVLKDLDGNLIGLHAMTPTGK